MLTEGFNSNSTIPMTAKHATFSLMPCSQHNHVVRLSPCVLRRRNRAPPACLKEFSSEKCSTASTLTQALPWPLTGLQCRTKRRQRRCTIAAVPSVYTHGRPQQQSAAWWRWLTRRVPVLEIASPLLRRLGMLATFLALSRIGNFIFLPNLDYAAVAADRASGAASAMLLQDVQGELLGASSPLTIYFLGIGPYINASWTISAIMLVKSPPPLYRHFQSLRRAGRETLAFAFAVAAGADRAVKMKLFLRSQAGFVMGPMMQLGASMIRVWTQTVAVAFAVVQGANRAIELRHFALRQARSVVTETMVHLVAGAMLLRWAVDQNSAHGLGDGISLLICAGIAARYAKMIQTLPRALAAIHPPAWKLLVAVAGCVALVYAATYITRLEKRLPLIYYKRRLRDRLQAGEHSHTSALPPEPQRAPDYIPLRVTPGGTGALLMGSFVFSMVPELIGSLSPAAARAYMRFACSTAALPWTFGVFVFLTSVLDFSGGTPAQEFSEWLASVDAGVKGVSPGPFTEEFLTKQQRTLRILGGLCMAGLAVAAQLFDTACSLHIGLSFHSMSLIMMSGYITTALRQAQSILQLPRLSRALAQEREAVKFSGLEA